MQMMASASSLLGLVSQLQSMESSFASILFEAAMKLSSLTDAKVFLMVDSPEGRSWAGHPILRHTFLNEGLHPQEEDTEIEVDPNVSAIVRKKKMAESLRNNSQSMASDLEDDDSYERMPTNYQRKRRLESQLSQHGVSAKKHGRMSPGRRGRKPKREVQSSCLDADFQTTNYDGLNEVAGSGPLHEVDEFGTGDSFQSHNADDAYQQQQQILPSQQQHQQQRPPPLTPIRFGSLGPATPNNSLAQLQTMARREGLSSPGAQGVAEYGVIGVGGDGTGAGDGEVQILEPGNGDFWAPPGDGANEQNEHGENRVADENLANCPTLPKAEGLESEIGGGQVVPFVNHEEDKFKFSLGIPDVQSDNAYLYPSGRISGKGTRPKAMWKGWRYSFHSESTIRNVMLFNCSHRQQNKCKGQISVNRDTLEVVGHKLHDFDTNPDIEATLQEIDEKELLAGFK